MMILLLLLWTCQALLAEQEIFLNIYYSEALLCFAVATAHNK